MIQIFGFTLFQNLFGIFVEELLILLGFILLGLTLSYTFSVYKHVEGDKKLSSKKESWKKDLRRACRKGDPKSITKIDSDQREKFKKFLAEQGPEICSNEKILKEIYKTQSFLKEDLELMEEDKWWKKARAIVRLKKLRIKEAEEKIFNILDHEKLEIRLASLDYLSAIRSSKIQSDLKNIFEKNSENLDRFLLIRLFSTNLRPESLKNFVNSSKPRLRRVSAIILGKEGQEESIPYLKNLSDDDESSVRLEVARSIGRIGSKEGLSLLSGLKSDKDAKVRAEVAKAVGKIGDINGLSLLEELVQDEVKKVKLRAFLSLAKLGEPGREIIGKYRSDNPRASKEALLRSFTEEV